MAQPGLPGPAKKDLTAPLELAGPPKQKTAPPDSPFVGRWKLVNDKAVVCAYLNVTRTFDATREHALDSPGKWEVVGNEAHFTWTDGCRDILRLEKDGGITYLALGREATGWDGLPQNQLKAVQIPTLPTKGNEQNKVDAPANTNDQIKKDALSRIDEEKERKVAEWVISRGGKAIVRPFNKAQNEYVSRDKVIVATMLSQLPERFLNYNISLDGRPITDLDIDKMKGIVDLRWICLRNTKLTDKGVARLATDHKHLERVDLDFTKVTDESFSSLMALPNLNDLPMKGTSVTKTGVNKLRKALPSCSVYWNGGIN
jgi:hypothetical protein